MNRVELKVVSLLFSRERQIRSNSSSSRHEFIMKLGLKRYSLIPQEEFTCLLEECTYDTDKSRVMR